MAQSGVNVPVSFGKDFTWGAATSAYQIEGAWNADGKGESIFDRFTHTPGHIKNNDTGDIAIDHYHLYREDVDLMKAIGLKAYRFSISWSRVIPEGTGQVNQAGLDFYDRLVDALVEAGIQPFATAYFWDLPQALQDKGGWLKRSTVDAFAEYTDVITRRVGDRVKAWATINEPLTEAHEGYVSGVIAPGHKDFSEGLVVSHHLLLAHSRALPVIRRNSPRALAGIVVNIIPFYPASASTYDQYDASMFDASFNRWYLDPLAGRGYPPVYVKEMDLDMGHVKGGDLDEIAAPLDYLGVNYYMRAISRSPAVPEESNMPVTLRPNEEKTDMDWEVYPEGLYDVLTRMHLEYNFPEYYITENGAAYADQQDANGEVHDPERISFLERHIAQAAHAMRDGVPLKGYFAWSLLDNFEWADGYSKRFGMVYVDFATQKRILKDSAVWYREWIERQTR